VVTPEQQVWAVRLSRRHHAQILRDPVLRELDREMKRAIADAEKRGECFEAIIEVVRAANDRIGEHLGLGPRPR
jgi:hypothetical protein